MTRRARRLALTLLTAGAVIGVAGPAAAHPLGNFTVNLYGGIVVQPERVLVDYVVDLAEIPAYQARGSIDADGSGEVSAAEAGEYRDRRCAELAGGVSLEVGGVPAPLTATLGSISFPPGAGGLPTLRLECRLHGDLRMLEGEVAISYLDTNYAGRLGWREVTAVGDGVTLSRSDVPATSTSARLTSYPADVLPLDITTASIHASPGGPRLGSLPGPGRNEVTSNAPSRDAGILAALAGRQDLSVPFVGLMVLVAIGVGAVHALGPGHGKALIGAFLVAGGGTLRQAVAVGAAVSVMHTASVLGLGLLVISAEQVLPAERVYPWLGFASGLVALALGSCLLVSRLHAVGWHGRGGDAADGHPHGHPHPHEAPLSRRGLAALAFSGGILPSPSALVVLLTSVSLGRTALGLLLITAFSAGLAASLIGVGALAVRARVAAVQRLPQRLMTLAPLASAAAIAVIGVVLTTRGLLQL